MEGRSVESELFSLFKDFGAPYLLLIAGAIGIWRVLVWFGGRIVTPLVESHTSLVKQLESTDKKQTELLEANTKTQEQILGTQKEIVELIKERKT